MSADAGEIRPKRQPKQVTGSVDLSSKQSTAAHEFGHAIGIDHVHCKGDKLVCYGTTQAEYDDVMGGGMKLQNLKVGSGSHSDFAAFERIGERWGKDVFTGALATKCNTWTSPRPPA